MEKTELAVGAGRVWAAGGCSGVSSVAQSVLSSNNIQSSIYQVPTVCHVLYLAGAYRKLCTPGFSSEIILSELCRDDCW